jgi:hypothetical protein
MMAVHPQAFRLSFVIYARNMASSDPSQYGADNGESQMLCAELKGEVGRYSSITLKKN